MSPDPTRRFQEQTAAQQRFLSLFLRSKRENFRYASALVLNVVDAQDVVRKAALTLWKKFEASNPAQPFTPQVSRFALNQANRPETHSPL